MGTFGKTAFTAAATVMFAAGMGTTVAYAEPAATSTPAEKQAITQPAGSSAAAAIYAGTGASAEYAGIVVAPEQPAPTTLTSGEQLELAVSEDVAASADTATQDDVTSPDKSSAQDVADAPDKPSAQDVAGTSDEAVAPDSSNAPDATHASDNVHDQTSTQTPNPADAKLTGIEFKRTDADAAQVVEHKISMTDKRSFEVRAQVEGITAEQLQTMIDNGSISYELSREKGMFSNKVYPHQYLGGKLAEWKTVATKAQASIPFFKDITSTVELIDGKPVLKLSFNNEYFYGHNGIDVRDRALVRSSMYDYTGPFDLKVRLANGSVISTSVQLRPYDEFMTQEELEAEMDRLVKKANDMGIYAKVEQFGTSAQGRPMKVVYVAQSAQDLADYQKLKKQAEKDPAKLMSQIKAGTLKYKVPVMYSNVHADEEPAVDAIIAFLRDLTSGKPVVYRRFTGLTEEGKKELKDEMALDRTVWSKLIEDKATGVGYIRGNGGHGNGINYDGAVINNASADLTEEEIAKYYTVEEKTFDPREILKKMFFILVPSENVDARTDNVRTNGNGFDLNRDNTYQTQPETQAMSGLITKWNPISLHEAHGFYQQYQVEPCSPTHDPNNEYDLFIDTAFAQGEYFASTSVANNKTINSVQMPLRDYLKKQKDGSVFWEAPFDDMSTSYTPQYAMMHGTNAFTVELPYGNSDGVRALEYGFIGNAEFVAQNRDRMFLNQLERFLRGINNVDAETIRKYYVNQKDVPGANADNFRPQNNENHNFFPEYYVIPIDVKSQQDRVSATETIKFLLHNGVKVSRLTRDMTYKGKTFKAGTYIVDMHQAKRNMANCALYPNLVIADWEQYSLYSEPVTNFSALRGYDMTTVRTKDAFKGMLQEIDSVANPKTYVEGKGQVTIIKNNSLDSIRAINDLLRQGKKVGLITKGAYEGSYVVRTADFQSVKDRWCLRAIQGTKTPEAKLIKNNLKLYVPIASEAFVYDQDGNPVGMNNYYNRLNTNGNWDFFALAKQMGFTLTNKLDEADMVVGSQYPVNSEAVAAAIKAGKPYVGYTADALEFVKDALIAGLQFMGQGTWLGFDALTTVEFPTDDLVTATYRLEGDHIMYGFGGGYFISVPKGAKILIKTTNDRPIEGFMTEEFLTLYKGQIQAISLLEDGMNMVLFANTLTNKAHQQDDYRYLTGAIFSRILKGLFPSLDIPVTPEVKPEVKPQHTGSAQHGSQTLVHKATHVVPGALPQTGDKGFELGGLAAVGFAMVGAGTALLMVRRREQK